MILTMSVENLASDNGVVLERPNQKEIKSKEKVHACGEKRARLFAYPFEKKGIVRGNRGGNITKVSVY